MTLSAVARQMRTPAVNNNTWATWPTQFVTPLFAACSASRCFFRIRASFVHLLHVGVVVVDLQFRRADAVGDDRDGVVAHDPHLACHRVGARASRP